jgi:hypothetical protein
MRSTIRVEYWWDVHLPEKPHTDLLRKPAGPVFHEAPHCFQGRQMAPEADISRTSRRGNGSGRIFLKGARPKNISKTRSLHENHSGNVTQNRFLRRCEKKRPLQ